MTGVVRAVAAGLILAGLAAGSGSGAAAPSAPMRHGDELIVAADLHVHSFPGDGGLPPWDLAREARRRGLDAIALTSHNNRLSWWVADRLGLLGGDVLLIPGEELTSSWYHMAALGARANVTWRQSAAAAVAQIHALGGVAIAAHPAREAAVGYDAAALEAIDGAEVAHPWIYQVPTGRAELQAFYDRARQRRPGIAPIGSTDFHFFAPIGFCRTYVFARERSVAAVVDAIRRGRTVACDRSGFVSGDPALTAVVADACRGAGLSTPGPRRQRDAAGAVLVWIGLFGLVVMDSTDRVSV
jgi:hypothetical protein